MNERSPILGACTRQWRIGDVRLSETRHPARSRALRHAHGTASMCFVLNGGFTEVQGRRSLACAAATVVWRPAWLEHEDAFGDDGAVCFNLEAPEELAKVVPERHDAAVRVSGPSAWAAARLVDEARQSAPGDALELELESRILELLCSLASPSFATAPRHVARAAALLRETPTVAWSLAGLAREVQLHPMHLARAFRHAHGASVGQFLRRERVEVASRALARTDQSLADVALAAGFADQPHFTRVFRRVTGMTPGLFRSTLRGDALRSFKTPGRPRSTLRV